MAASSDPAPTGEAVGRRTFSTSFRGFDQGEVRAYLDLLAVEFVALQERIAELEEHLQEARRPVPPPPLDVATLTTALGEETARVLRAAQEAADDLRARAEEGAARTLRESQEEAARLRNAAESVLAERTAEAEEAATRLQREGEEEAARLRREASAEAEGTIAEAVERGRDMLAQAQAARERVLADLSRRRKAALARLEALRAGRERLLTSLGSARAELDHMTTDLDRADEEARKATEAAGRTGARTTGNMAASSSSGLPDSPSVAGEGGDGPAEVSSSGRAVPSARGPAAAPGGGGDQRSPAGAGDGAAAVRGGEATDTAVEDPPGWAGAQDEGGEGTTGTPHRRPVEPSPAPRDPAVWLPSPVDGPTVAHDAVAAEAAEVAAAGRMAGVLGGASGVDADAAGLGSEPPVDPAAAQPSPSPDEPVPALSHGAPEGGAAGNGEAAAVDPQVGAVDAEAVAVDGEAGAVDAEAVAFDGEAAPPGEAPARPTRLPYPHDPVPVAVLSPAAVGGSPPAAVGGGRPAGRVDQLFARIRADRAHAVEEAHAVLAPGGTQVRAVSGGGSPPEAPDAGRRRKRRDRNGGDGQASLLEPRPPAGGDGPPVSMRGVGDAAGAEAPVTGGGEDPALEAPRSDADESYLQRRDVLVEVVQATTVRSLKRALADDQNATLDRMRTRSASTTEVDVLVGDEVAQRQAWVRRAAAGLAAAAAAGASLVAGGGPVLDPAGVDPAGVDPAVPDPAVPDPAVPDPAVPDPAVPDPSSMAAIAERLVAELIGPLRARLADVLEAVGGDRGADTVDRVNSVYREWRGRIDRAVGDAVTEAVSAGVGRVLAPGTPVRWVVEDVDGPCPDCDDNALAGAVPLGEAFPTGQAAPPAHPGCRCVLAQPT